MVACTFLNDHEVTNVTDTSLRELIDLFPKYTVIESRYFIKKLFRKPVEVVYYSVYYHYSDLRMDVQHMNIDCKYESVYSYFLGLYNGTKDGESNK